MLKIYEMRMRVVLHAFQLYSQILKDHDKFLSGELGVARGQLTFISDTVTY
jgi:hypothetical protein